MALQKMSTTIILVFVFAFAGLCQGEDQQCSTNQTDVFFKMMTCASKNHPDYFITVLTRIKNPGSMEDPDFMCSNEGMMSAMVKCLLQYVKGCMPPDVANQVAEFMPTQETIQRGIHFICQHRKDFENPCVMNQLTKLVQCMSTKMQTYSQVTRSVSRNMRNQLCFALQQEEQCLDTSLTQCPYEVTANIKHALTTFFPDKCPKNSNNVLHFQSERWHY